MFIYLLKPQHDYFFGLTLHYQTSCGQSFRKHQHLRRNRFFTHFLLHLSPIGKSSNHHTFCVSRWNNYFLKFLEKFFHTQYRNASSSSKMWYMMLFLNISLSLFLFLSRSHHFSLNSNHCVWILWILKKKRNTRPEYESNFHIHRFMIVFDIWSMMRMNKK